MHRTFKLFFIFTLLRSLAADTIIIPDPSSSIQEGINNAVFGDTILVGPGIYDEQLIIRDKSITLASQYILSQDTSFINTTILDGGNRDAVIEIDSSAGSETTITGFTIQNGVDGIYPTAKFNLLNNRIQNCSDGVDYETGSGGICRDNIFIDNEDDGIDLDGAVDIIIENNRILNNDDDGIEIRLHEYSGPQLTVIIQNNIISGNQEDGIQLIDYPDISDRVYIIKNNLIINNAMAALGCMSDGNTVENYEGASIIESIYFLNNTVYGNDYGVTGGDNLIAKNNIIANCTGTAMKNVDNNSIISFSNLWGNGLNFENSNIDDLTMVYADPHFSDTQNNDFQLTHLSAGIDIGDSLSSKDPDSTRADAGMYYYHQSLSDFSLIQPTADSLIHSRFPQFIWQSSQPAGEELITYDLYLTKAPFNPDSVSIIISNIRDSLYTLSDTLNDFSQYRWKILAKNPWALEKWSKENWIFSINTDTIPPVIDIELIDLNFNEDDSILVERSFWFPYVNDESTHDSSLVFEFTSGDNIMTYSRGDTSILRSESNWFGFDSIQISVTDNGNLTTKSSLTVRVNPKNDPPEIHDLPDSLSFFSDSSLTIELWDYILDIESPDSLLIIDFHSSTDSILYNFDLVSGHLTLSSPGFIGNTQLTISVMDDSNAVDTDSIRISSIQRNLDAPKISATLPAMLFYEDDSVYIPDNYWYPYIEDNDSADSLLTYRIYEGDYISVNHSGNAHLLKSPLNWFGSDTLRLEVTDPENLSISSNFVVSVRSVNDSPYFKNLPDSITIHRESAYTINIWEYVEDIETPDSLLTYKFWFPKDSIQLNFTASTGQLELLPTENVNKTTLHIEVSDDSSLTISDSLLVNIDNISEIETQDENMIPASYILKQNYPNPFNPMTTIVFGLPEPSYIRLEIYNSIGQKILTLYEGRKNQGYHKINWDAEDYSSGIYIYRLSVRGSKNSELINKMILLK